MYPNYNQGQPSAPNAGSQYGYSPNQGAPNAGSQYGYSPNPGAPNTGSQYGYSPNPAAQTNYGISPEIQQWFAAVDADRSGQINAKELQAALVNGQGNNFSDSVCSLMINTFGKEQRGTISIREFQHLHGYVNNWINVFRTYDRDNSGYIEEEELSSALQQMGFMFSPQFYKTVLTNGSNIGQTTVDGFIEFCMRLQRITELFRAKDVEQKGVITIGYEDFVNVCLTCLS